MLLTMLKCKLHNAVVTEANIEYEGSVAIDADLMKEAGFLAGEQVEIYNITNGERFTTYVIKGEGGSKTIGIQGAAAHKASKGDRVIICAYAQMDENAAKQHRAVALMMDENNNIKVRK